MSANFSQPIVKVVDQPKAQAGLLGSHSFFVNWNMLGQEGYEIYPLLGRRTPLILPELHASIGGVQIPPFPLQAVSADSNVYRPGETAHLAIYLPKWANRKVTMLTSFQSTPASSFEIQIDEFGMAHYVVPNLKMGSYRVEVKQCPTKFVQFNVEKFVLQPLNAKLVAHEREGNDLNVMVSVMTYGSPFLDDRSFRLELQLNGHEVAVLEEVKTKSSTLFGTFTMPQGDGRLSVLVRNNLNAKMIAQVVIPSPEKAELRDGTVISKLGTTWQISAINLTGGQEIRGLSLRNLVATSSNAPIEPVNVICKDGLAEFRLMMDMEALLFQVYNPDTGGFDLHSFTNNMKLKKSTVISFPFHGVWTRPYISAWVRSRGEQVLPWEGFTTLIKANKMRLEVFVPEQTKPGTTVPVTITVNGVVAEKVPVFVTVTEARKMKSTSLQLDLAAATMEGVVGTPTQEAAFVSQDIAGFYQIPVSKSSAIRTSDPQMREFRLPSSEPVRRGGANTRPVQLPSDDELTRLMMGTFRSEVSQPEFLGFPDDSESVLETMSVKGKLRLTGTAVQEQVQQVVMIPTRQEEDLGTIFAGLLYLDRGRCMFDLELPNVITTLNVEVFAVSGDHYGEVVEQVEVTQNLFAKLHLPLQMELGDQVVASAHLHCKLNEAAITVLVNGQPQQFAVGGAIFDSGTTIRTFPCMIEYDVRAGDEVTIQLSDANGQDMVSGKVGVIGKYEYTVKLPKILQPGESLALDESIVGLKVMPSPLQLITDVTTTINRVQSYMCFGQTGQTNASNMVMAVQGNAAAIAAVLEGVARSKSMFVSGQGAKYYPHYHYVEQAEWENYAANKPQAYTHFYWVHMGTMALLSMRQWLSHPAMTIYSELGVAVHEAVRIAQDCARVYGIPTQHTSMRADMPMRVFYEIACVDNNPLVALHYMQEKLAQPMPQHPGERRELLAYGACVYARAQKWPEALRLANTVMAEFDKSGKPYSYSEQLAVLLMMSELRALNNAEVLLNGIFNMTAEDAAKNEYVRAVTCVKGAVLVLGEVKRFEDWDAFDISIPLEAAVTDRNGFPITMILQGDGLTLKVSFANGYKPGELIALLPCDALAFMTAGVNSREMEIDPQGSNSVVIDIVASKSTRYTIHSQEVRPQKMRVIGRDMNNEIRFGSLQLPITIH